MCPRHVAPAEFTLPAMSTAAPGPTDTMGSPSSAPTRTKAKEEGISQSYGTGKASDSGLALKASLSSVSSSAETSASSLKLEKAVMRRSPVTVPEETVMSLACTSVTSSENVTASHQGSVGEGRESVAVAGVMPAAQYR